MRAATGPCPRSEGPPCPSSLSCGFEHPVPSSHPARIPELPPVFLCIPEGLQPPHWKLKEDHRRPAAQLEELALCPAQPGHLSGTYLNVLARTLPRPPSLGAPSSQLLGGSPQGPCGPECRCVYLCLPPTLSSPRCAGLWLSASLTDCHPEDRAWLCHPDRSRFE